MERASQTQLSSLGWTFLLKAPHWLLHELPSCFFGHPTSSYCYWKSLEGNHYNQWIKSVKNIKKQFIFLYETQLNYFSIFFQKSMFKGRTIIIMEDVTLLLKWSTINIYGSQNTLPQSSFQWIVHAIVHKRRFDRGYYQICLSLLIEIRLRS